MTVTLYAGTGAGAPAQELEARLDENGDFSVTASRLVPGAYTVEAAVEPERAGARATFLVWRLGRVSDDASVAAGQSRGRLARHRPRRIPVGGGFRRSGRPHCRPLVAGLEPLALGLHGRLGQAEPLRNLAKRGRQARDRRAGGPGLRALDRPRRQPGRVLWQRRKPGSGRGAAAPGRRLASACGFLRRAGRANLRRRQTRRRAPRRSSPRAQRTARPDRPGRRERGPARLCRTARRRLVLDQASQPSPGPSPICGGSRGLPVLDSDRNRDDSGEREPHDRLDADLRRVSLDGGARQARDRGAALPREVQLGRSLPHNGRPTRTGGVLERLRSAASPHWDVHRSGLADTRDGRRSAERTGDLHRRAEPPVRTPDPRRRGRHRGLHRHRPPTHCGASRRNA